MNITVAKGAEGYLASLRTEETEVAKKWGDSPRSAVVALALLMIPDPRHGDGEYCEQAATTRDCPRSHRWG